MSSHWIPLISLFLSCSSLSHDLSANKPQWNLWILCLIADLCWKVHLLHVYCTLVPHKVEVELFIAHLFDRYLLVMLSDFYDLWYLKKAASGVLSHVRRVVSSVNNNYFTRCIYFTVNKYLRATEFLPYFMWKGLQKKSIHIVAAVPFFFFPCLLKNILLIQTYQILLLILILISILWIQLVQCFGFWTHITL